MKLSPVVSSPTIDVHTDPNATIQLTSEVDEEASLSETRHARSEADGGRVRGDADELLAE